MVSWSSWLLQTSCSGRLADKVVNDPASALWCPWTQQLPLSGVLMLMAFAGSVGLFRWSQGNVTLPLTWFALVSGVALGALPGPFARPALALIVIGAIMGGIGVIRWWST